MTFTFGPRRATYVDISEAMPPGGPLTQPEVDHLEAFDLLYRSLCALLFNYVPTSGHPGGSISSGRAVAAVLFDALDYDLSDPDRPDADLISYAAGHKAMGLYAMWALRDEVAAVADPALLPASLQQRLRLEDLLGFRRNPITATPLFRRFGARALDGHPTPATPFVKLATGASGVGVASSIGLGFGAADRYGADAPRVHIIEGEGGLTPGRVSEALAAAGTASLANLVVHLDWNQASIDSDHVCRDGVVPGDYVQWDPRELFYLHDWNVVEVPDGHDVQQVVAAQRHALALDTGQPTAIVYHTRKGWRYGVEGKASHGAGHKLCSEGFYEALAELSRTTGAELDLPTCAARRAALRRRRRRHGPRGVLLDGAAGDQDAGARAAADGGGARAAPRRRPRPPRGARTGPPARRPAPRRSLRARGGGRAGRARAGGDPARAAPRARHLHHPPRRVRPRAAPPAGGQRRGVPRRRRRPHGLHEREHHRRRVPARLLERALQPRGTAALRRRDLRRRHRRRPQRHHGLRARPGRRFVLRGVHGAAQPHRGAPARHRRPGAQGRLRRALQADDPGLRARRSQDRRGRADARGSAAAATAAGGLPQRDRRLADAVGAAGDLDADGGGAGAAARGHLDVRDAAGGTGARPAGPGPRAGRGGGLGRLRAAHRASRPT